MNTCKRKIFIDSLKESGEWKTQLAAWILLKSSKDIHQNQHKYLWGDNKEIMIHIATAERRGELFKSVLTSYQEALEIKMKSIGFVSDCVDELSYYAIKSIVMHLL